MGVLIEYQQIGIVEYHWSEVAARVLLEWVCCKSATGVHRFADREPPEYRFADGVPTGVGLQINYHRSGFADRIPWNGLADRVPPE